MNIAETIAEGVDTTNDGAWVMASWEDDTPVTVLGRVVTYQTEYERRICSHSGNCPCAGREVTIREDVIVWQDASVSLADDTEVFAEDWDAMDEILVERDLSMCDSW